MITPPTTPTPDGAGTEQRLPFALNREQPGTINDAYGAVVCICLDSGIASKQKRAAYIVESANSHPHLAAQNAELRRALERIANYKKPHAGAPMLRIVRSIAAAALAKGGAA